MKQWVLIFSLLTTSLIAQSRTAVIASIAQDENLLALSFRSGKVAYIPAIGIHSLTDVGTDYSINITPRFYTSSSQTAPFISVKVGFLHKANPSNNLFSTGLGFGGEHIINEALAFGVELMLNYNHSFNKNGRDEFITIPKIFVAVYL